MYDYYYYYYLLLNLLMFANEHACLSLLQFIGETMAIGKW